MAESSVIHPHEPLTLQNLIPTRGSKKKKATRNHRDRQERMTLAEAFELGDSDDRERVVRAAALLLHWSTQHDLARDKLVAVALGVSDVLYGME